MKITSILPRLGAALVITVFLNGGVFALFNYAATQGSEQSAATAAHQA